MKKPRQIICIAGPVASGKSTLASHLKRSYLSRDFTVDIVDVRTEGTVDRLWDILLPAVRRDPKRIVIIECLRHSGLFIQKFKRRATFITLETFK